MPFPWSLFRTGTPVTLAKVSVVMYTRSGCHLCERAWKELRRFQRKYGFRLESVDIDANSELASRFGKEIPVVLVNGKLRFRGAIQPVLLERLLSAEAERQRREDKAI